MTLFRFELLGGKIEEIKSLGTIAAKAASVTRPVFGILLLLPK